MSVDFRPGSGQPTPPPGLGSEDARVGTDSPVSGPRPTPKQVDGPGVEAPRPEPEKAAPPRRTIAQRLGHIAKRVAQGAAIVGMAAALIVGGGAVLNKVSDHQPPSAPVQIEAPREVQDPSLPGGQGPPPVELEAPGTTPDRGTQGPEGRGPTLPTAPAETETPPGAVEGQLPQGTPQLDRDNIRPQQLPQNFNPLTIRLDSARNGQ